MEFKIWEQENPDPNNIPEVLVYLPEIRAYGYYLDRKLPIIQYILYCPFCGSKLPDDLEEEYWEAIINEAGPEFYPTHENYDPNKHLPPEFQTDEWWKKRGL
jgi:hypothetical protein